MNAQTLQDIANRQAPVGSDERRGHERVGGRVLVRIGTRQALNRGLVHNLSLGGLGVYTRVVYPPGTTVTVTVEGGGGATLLSVEGQVRWSRIVDGVNPDAVYEMGIRLMDVTAEYKAFFADHCARQSGVVATPRPAPAEAPAADERRVQARKEAYLPVEFVDPPDLAPTLTRNITCGGALVQGCTELTEGAIVVVDVRLPEIPEAIRAIGIVKHVRQASPGDPGGVGLAFERFYAGARERLAGYLDEVSRTRGVLAFPTVPRNPPRE